MKLTDTLLYLVVNGFHIYIFFLTFEVLFGKSLVKKEFQFFGFFVFYIINSTAFLLIGNPYLNLATSAIPLLALTFLFSGKVFQKLMCSIFVIVASMLAESIVQNILRLNEYAFQISEPIVINILADMCLFAVVMIFRKSHRKNFQKALRLEYLLAIIALPIGSMIITMLIYSSGYQPKKNLIIVTFLIVMNVLAFNLYEVLNQFYISNYERRLLQQQNEAYVQEVKLIWKADESIHLIRHDLKNHISVMQQLLTEKQYKNLEYYLDGFTKVMIEETYVNTGNPTIDSILNYKFSEATAIGSEITQAIVIPEQLSIEPFDSSVILGNLLDNAIEAMQKSEEKKLNVHIFYERGVLYIDISNTYSGDVRPIYRKGRMLYKTSKKQANIHGLGLTSVLQTVEKYQGNLTINDSDHQFSVKIMLYLP